MLHYLCELSFKHVRLGRHTPMIRLHYSLPRLVQISLAAILSFASVVEFTHFRFYEKRKNRARMIFTLTAAIAPAYMASECLTGDWPAWDKP